MKKMIQKLLQRSFDETLDPNEQKQLDKTLSESKELRIEQKQIAAIRELAAQSATREFKPFFEDRVIKRIRQIGVSSIPNGNWQDYLLTVFRPVSIVASVAILALVVYNFSTGGSLSLENLFGIPEYSIENLVYAVR